MPCQQEDGPCQLQYLATCQSSILLFPVLSSREETPSSHVPAEQEVHSLLPATATSSEQNRVIAAEDGKAAACASPKRVTHSVKRGVGSAVG